MDQSKKQYKPHPRVTANCLSILTFWWTLKTFLIGYSRDIEEEDLYDPLIDHKSDIIGDKLEKNWKKELKKTKPSFLKALIRTFGLRFPFLVFIFAIVELTSILQPLFLGRLLRYFSSNSDVTIEEAYLNAFGVIFCSGLIVFLIHTSVFGVAHLGMQLRVSTSSLIYRKSLKLSHNAMKETTAGQVVNLLSNDVSRFDYSLIFLNDIWICTLETIICAYLMWREMGPTSLIGIATLLITIPIQGFLGKKTATTRMQTAIRTDIRVKLMNEIISGIQVIKMYTWEKPFAKLVSDARKREIAKIKINCFIKGIFLSLKLFVSRTTLFVSVMAYVLLGNQITAERVYVMASYYEIIRQGMTVYIPQAITQIAESSVTLKRIQNFLLLDEISGPAKIVENETKKQGGAELKNATAKWSNERSENTIQNINITINCGQLLAVIGPVGAGKSSLIHAILGELPLISGNLAINGCTSYAAQEPWLFAGSVRQNILFGEKYEHTRYWKVIRVCSLEKDLNQFPHSDKTIIGERGVLLSGGQKARVSLARAVYKQSDIYLLDDPLSAVDAHVGRHLFDDCIKGFLANKAVLLVTHQLQYLNQANKIVILNNGKIDAHGTYSELQESGLDFAQLLAKDSVIVDDKELDTDGLRKRRISHRSSGTGSANSNLDEALVKPITITKNHSSSLDLDKEEPKFGAEMKASGKVSSSVYGEYFKAGGNFCRVFIMFSLFFFAQLAASGTDYCLAFWTNWEEYRNRTVHSEFENVTNITETENYNWLYANPWFTTEKIMCIYSVLICLLCIFALIRVFVFFNSCMKASTHLHDKMFSSVTRATMAFFNNNPSGRILNRFSKDIGSVDEMLPPVMMEVLQIGLIILGQIIVVAIVNTWLLIPTAIIGLIFYYIRNFYLATSRSIKRLEGTTKSPVFTYINASIQGLSTIRAFGAQSLLTKEFDGHQDLHSSAWYLHLATNRAFGFCLDIFCLFYLAIVTFSFLIFGTETFGGNVGLAITQCLGLMGSVQWGIRQSAVVETCMTSVERVLEYSELESEPPLETEKEPSEDWPRNGEIKFEDLSLTYNICEEPVLNEINFTIHSGEKIGIVGRTGAGKSSLIAALFRLAKNCSGRILLDGIDTSIIGLHKLRANISIIPQEPVLFSGTMRKNLDPFDEFTDETLWKALEEVELKEHITELAGGLSARMSEGGSNLSVGQRQLVCLARAILRNNRILVLDEATANVDPKTDALIQETIRRKFAHCTVLTIAHRLHTVMDSDRILVMEGGRVAEFAPPNQLLSYPESFLSKLVNQTGHDTAMNLRQKANLL